MQTSLQVVVLRLGNPGESEAYANALREIFVGTDPVGPATFGSKEILHAGEFREILDEDWESVSELATEKLGFLRSAERLLLIVLNARDSQPPSPVESLATFETDLLGILAGSAGNRQIVLHVYLKYPGELYQSALPDPRVVRLGLTELDERDLRLPFLVLYSLHNAVRLFAPATSGGSTPKSAKLFFSHAKRDGVPLTQATRDWMKRLRGFEAFYDTENLDLDGDVDSQLSKAVSNAVVIVFRSELFDQRYWCQKEVLWAEQHGRPVVTVDARWQVEYGPSVINFDSTPVVRIPDGSVVRIFTAALLEALRVELFRARVGEHTSGLHSAEVASIPRYPSLVSLHEACMSLLARASKCKRAYVVYPNPSLPSVMLAAASGLVGACVNNCELKSLDEFRLVA